jgi:cytochrome c peroxidase
MTDAEFVAQAWGIPADEAARTPEVMQKAWAKVYLGRRLFHDTRLSTTNQVSCASCHDLTLGGTDNLPKSEGVPAPDGKPQLGGVNAPTVYNAAGNIRQFWDGRAANLKEQAGGPPLNPVEMGFSCVADWDIIAGKLNKDPELVALFAYVFGDRGITGDTITEAIAAYEQTLVTPDSAFDRYLKGDETALTDSQKAGMKSFVDLGCATCHSGPTLGGISFEYINTHADMRALATPADYNEGAFGLRDFTRKEEHKDMFRVPNLRNVALTAPYFHTGTVNSLQEAVRIMILSQNGAGAAQESTVKNITRFLEAQTGKLYGKPANELTPQDVKLNPVQPQLP